MSKGNNPARRYNNSKYTCIEHWCPKFKKQTLLNLKEQIEPDTISVGNLNTPFSSTDTTSRPN
jgi:hypothetical protein